MINASELDFTGERLTTEICEYWSIEHLHRYALALNLISKKRVVDIASGEGYGTHLMAGQAQNIIGIDISQTAVNHAAKKYKKPNLSYLQGSAIKMPLDSKSIDVVVSFETIEHHNEHDKMMQEINRVLTPEGLLIISSPDKKFYSDIPKYSNPFHVKELYAEEFNQLIRNYFKYSVMLSQKTVFGSFISSSETVHKSFIEFSGDYINIRKHNTIQHSLYNICIASNSLLNDLPIIEHSVFCNQDMFEKYLRLKAENEELNNINMVLNNKLKRPVQKIVNAMEFPFKIVRKIVALRK